jgi:hypothetical protein
VESDDLIPEAAGEEEEAISPVAVEKVDWIGLEKGLGFVSSRLCVWPLLTAASPYLL